MANNLVIIESPNKIKTIAKYLGNDYQIIATVGHLRDIPKSNFNAFDPKTFEPKWKIIKQPKNKKEVVDIINKQAKKAKKIYLATDPDREGEAIAWHVYDLLEKKEKNKCVRITFNEITEEAIKKAIENERKIQIAWVHSQFVRRILDRVIGYDLSKFVHKKFNGISAGRVQSVVLKLLNLREKQIANFKPKKWFTINVKLKNDDQITLYGLKESNDINIKNEDYNVNGNEINFKSKEIATKIVKNLNNEFIVSLIDPPKLINYASKDPYKTSTLQQDAITKLGWNLNRIASVIQDLYEGIDLENDHLALITYPRTDSIRMADTFVKKAKNFIKKTYGEKYVLQKKRSLKMQKQKENVQDAHECIRIIDPYLTPEKLKNKINDDYYKMYQLIWQRTIASLMSPMIVETTSIKFLNNNCQFCTSNRKIIFDGFKHIFPQAKEENKENKNYKLNEKYTAKLVETSEHISKPPERYSQASLIKILDESGIGRPSTYKIMADIVLTRGYCQLINRSYCLTPIGTQVIEGLNKYFDDVINFDFTKKMEQRLDLIANKKEKWNEWLMVFVPKFKHRVDEITKSFINADLNVGRNCPKCNHPLVYRFSKISKKQFIGCSNYPKCKYVEFPQPQKIEIKCPKCGGNLLYRFSKISKKQFIGCSNYPKCNFICNSLEQLQKQVKQNGK